MEAYGPSAFSFPKLGSSPTFGTSIDPIAIQPSIHNQQIFDRAIESTANRVADDSIRNRAISVLRFLNSAIKMRGIVVELPKVITDFNFEEAYYELIVNASDLFRR